MNSFLEFDIREELKKLPKKPGVYLMHGPDDEIIYVGKAVNLFNRVHQYFQNPESKSVKIQRMISLIRRFEYIVVGSELEALVLENNLIKENRPKYNTLLKDDKTYPFIKVSLNEAYPRIFMTRHFIKDKGKYFGPYTSVNSVHECIDLLHKLFMIRTCSRNLPKDCGKERPCLYHHIGQCLAPCTGNVSTEEYEINLHGALEFLNGKYQPVRKKLETLMLNCSENMEFEKAAEYRDLIRAVDALSVQQNVTSRTDQDDRDIIGIARNRREAVAQVFFIREGVMVGRENFHLDADPDESIPELVSSFVNRFYTGTPYIPKEIHLQASIAEQKLTEEWLAEASGHRCRIYTPKNGSKEKLVQMAVDNAEIVLRQDSERIHSEEARTKGASEEIRELLQMDCLHRIESYDISNTSGFEPVGSMVVFYDGKPLKSDYRKFRLKTVDGPDDYASMKEVLLRRFSHGREGNFGAFPDLILMDGGKGQVGIALSVMNELGVSVPVAGMVKDDHHRTRGLIFNGRELPVDIHSEGFKLITRIQDETHRFAIEYHKSLRSEKQVHSVLDDIPNIGEKRRRSLMRHFKTIDAVRSASVDDLCSAESMDERSANSVYSFFHTKEND